MASALYKRKYRAIINAKKYLEQKGYTAIRSAKSEGIFDLIGFDKTRIILIKVRTCPQGKVPIYLGEKEQMKKVKAPKNAKKELWVSERRLGWHYFVV